MFNFKNLESLLDVKWNTTFKDAAPNGTSSDIDKKNFEDIISGAIISIIAHISLFICGIRLSSMGTDITAAKASFFNLIPIIFSIVILVCNIHNYKRLIKVDGTFNYVTLLLTFFYSIAAFIMPFVWLKAFDVSAVIGFIAIVSIIFVFIGNFFILSGNVGFAEKLYNEHIHQEQLNQQVAEITVSRINQDEVSDHSFKYCKFCGEKNDANNQLCSKCGYML